MLHCCSSPLQQSFGSLVSCLDVATGHTWRCGERCTRTPSVVRRCSTRSIPRGEGGSRCGCDWRGEADTSVCRTLLRTLSVPNRASCGGMFVPMHAHAPPTPCPRLQRADGAVPPAPAAERHAHRLWHAAAAQVCLVAAGCRHNTGHGCWLEVLLTTRPCTWVECTWRPAPTTAAGHCWTWTSKMRSSLRRKWRRAPPSPSDAARGLAQQEPSFALCMVLV